MNNRKPPARLSFGNTDDKIAELTKKHNMLTQATASAINDVKERVISVLNDFANKISELEDRINKLEGNK